MRYSFQNEPGKYVSVIQHLEGLGIELLATALAHGTYSIETDSAIPENQVEHLGMTEA